MNTPVQVYLDEEDHRRLDDWARERGWTRSQALRVAIRAVTARASGDPLLDLEGVFDALPPDLSQRIDRYLEETLVAETRPKYRRPTRSRAGRH